MHSLVLFSPVFRHLLSASPVFLLPSVFLVSSEKLPVQDWPHMISVGLSASIFALAAGEQTEGTASRRAALRSARVGNHGVPLGQVTDYSLVFMSPCCLFA